MGNYFCHDHSSDQQYESYKHLISITSNQIEEVNKSFNHKRLTFIYNKKDNDKTWLQSTL